MPDHFNSSYNNNNSEIRESILRGILGSVTGMIVCILAMLLCSWNGQGRERMEKKEKEMQAAGLF
jgi:hypothetical protein